VVGKLLLTLFAVAVLLRHMQDVSRVARLAKETTLSKAAFHPELIHAAGGLLVLFAAMILSVFKPWGMTAYGRRGASQSRLSARPAVETTPGREPVLVTRRVRWGRVVGIHAILLVLLLGILHTTGLLHH